MIIQPSIREVKPSIPEKENLKVEITTGDKIKYYLANIFTCGMYSIYLNYQLQRDILNNKSVPQLQTWIRKGANADEWCTLGKAIEKGNTQALKVLLENGGNANHIDETIYGGYNSEKFTFEGYRSYTTTLLEYSFNHFSGKTPLNEIVKVLLDYGAKPQSKDITRAVYEYKYGKNDQMYQKAISVLINHKINSDDLGDIYTTGESETFCKTLIASVGCNELTIDSFKKILKSAPAALFSIKPSGYNFDAYIFAKEFVSTAIKTGKEEFILEYCKYSNNFEMIKLIISEFVNLDHKDKSEFFDKFFNHLEENNIKYNLNDLMFNIAAKGTVEQANRLIKYLKTTPYFDINTTNELQENAGHVAAKNGKLDILQVLLDSGIDVNKKDKNGLTILDISNLKK